MNDSKTNVKALNCGKKKTKKTMYTAAIICDKRKNKLHDKGLGSVKAKQDKT